MLTGRMSRWALLLSEYDVKLVTPTTIKNQALADLLSICPEKATIKELSDQIPRTIETISFEHVPRTENKHVNALATLESSVTIQNGQHTLEHRVVESSAKEERMSVEGKTNDWQTPIHEQIRTLTSPKKQEDFVSSMRKCSKKSNNGLLVKCVGEEEGKEKA
ncbi:hypothetical protein Ahy_Scaffold5g107789 [Arachis hypogaea]|uniref:RNase H type-1 domain-containing protein n=1 Tax=Arachis hypogaea TaxID=3818 RepID=A0A444WQ68_ARAHY|nr:hypothetical protein Ahy_Scaffold5g107789 [Arachis hypogaea]